MNAKKRLLNLGCGQRYHPDWTNIDFRSRSEFVIAHNLSKGIPVPNESFDLVYHSHLLEHVSKSQASDFLKECHRVLRPQAILRIAVPDLEQITRRYLLALEQALAGSQEAVDNYNWLLLELFDQMVRDQSGGEMVIYLHQKHISNQAFILKRLGTEAKRIIESGRQQHPKPPLEPRLKRILRPAYQFLRNSHYRREIILRKLLGSTDYQSLQVGRFRQGGEIHQWMYDRYSLQRLLKQCGFTGIVQRTAATSYVPDWSSFNLDTEPDGSIYKPDSLFMEAVKPPL